MFLKHYKIFIDLLMINDLFSSIKKQQLNNRVEWLSLMNAVNSRILFKIVKMYNCNNLISFCIPAML